MVNPTTHAIQKSIDATIPPGEAKLIMDLTLP
jgi:hypothetical protein